MRLVIYSVFWISLVGFLDVVSGQPCANLSAISLTCYPGATTNISCPANTTLIIASGGIYKYANNATCDAYAGSACPVETSVTNQAVLAQCNNAQSCVFTPMPAPTVPASCNGFVGLVFLQIIYNCVGPVATTPSTDICSGATLTGQIVAATGTAGKKPSDLDCYCTLTVPAYTEFQAYIVVYSSSLPPANCSATGTGLTITDPSANVITFCDQDFYFIYDCFPTVETYYINVFDPQATFNLQFLGAAPGLVLQCFNNQPCQSLQNTDIACTPGAPASGVTCDNGTVITVVNAGIYISLVGTCGQYGANACPIELTNTNAAVMSACNGLQTCTYVPDLTQPVPQSCTSASFNGYVFLQTTYLCLPPAGGSGTASTTLCGGTVTSSSISLTSGGSLSSSLCTCTLTVPPNVQFIVQDPTYTTTPSTLEDPNNCSQTVQMSGVPANFSFCVQGQSTTVDCQANTTNYTFSYQTNNPAVSTNFGMQILAAQPVTLTCMPPSCTPPLSVDIHCVKDGATSFSCPSGTVLNIKSSGIYKPFLSVPCGQYAGNTCPVELPNTNAATIALCQGQATCNFNGQTTLPSTIPAACTSGFPGFLFVQIVYNCVPATCLSNVTTASTTLAGTTTTTTPACSSVFNSTVSCLPTRGASVPASPFCAAGTVFSLFSAGIYRGSVPSTCPDTGGLSCLIEGTMTNASVAQACNGLASCTYDAQTTMPATDPSNCTSPGTFNGNYFLQIFYFCQSASCAPTTLTTATTTTGTTTTGTTTTGTTTTASTTTGTTTTATTTTATTTTKTTPTTTTTTTTTKPTTTVNPCTAIKLNMSTCVTTSPTVSTFSCPASYGMIVNSATLYKAVTSACPNFTGSVCTVENAGPNYISEVSSCNTMNSCSHSITVPSPIPTACQDPKFAGPFFLYTAYTCYPMPVSPNVVANCAPTTTTTTSTTTTTTTTTPTTTVNCAGVTNTTLTCIPTTGGTTTFSCKTGNTMTITATTLYKFTTGSSCAAFGGSTCVDDTTTNKNAITTQCNGQQTCTFTAKIPATLSTACTSSPHTGQYEIANTYTCKPPSCAAG